MILCSHLVLVDRSSRGNLKIKSSYSISGMKTPRPPGCNVTVKLVHNVTQPSFIQTTVWIPATTSSRICAAYRNFLSIESSNPFWMMNLPAKTSFRQCVDFFHRRYTSRMQLNRASSLTQPQMLLQLRLPEPLHIGRTSPNVLGKSKAVEAVLDH